MPLYDFECPACDYRFEMMLKHAELVEMNYTQSCRECGKWALYVPTVGAIHTLATHFRGTGISYGEDYVDENLCDPRTRTPTVVTSLNHKRRLLKEYGLYEKGENAARAKALKRRVSVTVRKPSGQAA